MRLQMRWTAAADPSHRARHRFGCRLVCVALSIPVASCGSTRDTSSHGLVASQTGHSRIVSVPWRLQSAKSRLVRLSWIGGGCLTPDRTRVVETRRSVEIAVLVRQYVPGAGEACTADARFYTVQIHLREPVGHRALVHAPLTPGAP